MKEEMRQDSYLIRKMFISSIAVLIFANISMMLGSLVDGIVVSRFLGDKAMAAFSLVNPVFNILMMIAGVISTGSQVVFTQYIGKGDAARARAVFNICLFFGTMLSALLGVLVFFGADFFGGLFGASGSNQNLLPMASGYLAGLAIGIPGTLLVPFLNAFMQIDSDKRRGIVAIAAMTAVNIAGDFANVFIFHGGMFGMALATSISFYVAVFILVLHFFSGKYMLKVSAKGLKSKDLADVFKNGIPSAIMNGCLMLQRVVLNYLLLFIAGQWAVSALGVSYTFYGFVNAVLSGIGQTMMLVSGVVSGEDDKDGLKFLMSISLKTVLISMVAVAVVICAATPVFVDIFMADTTGQSYQAAMLLFRVNALGLPFAGISIIFIMYLQGIRNIGLTRLLTFLEKAVYIIVLSIILGFLIGANGVWISLPIAEVLTVATILFIAGLQRKRKGSFSRALLFLPSDFGVSDENIYSVAINDVSDISETTERLQHFVKGHGGTQREAMMIPLCIEEMAGNSLRYGFADDRKRHIEVKVIRHEGGWLVRINDDGMPFDPTDWIRIHENEDKTANIGIRMVTAVAKEVRYVSTMQMNHLIINI